MERMESDDREEFFTLILSLSGQGLVSAQIAKRLGVKPSEPFGGRKRQAAQSSVSTEGHCSYWFTGEHQQPLEEVLQGFFKLFHSREEELVKVTHEFNAELTIKLTWNEGDYLAPSFNLSHENLRKFSELNLSLEVSTDMVYADDGSCEDDPFDDDEEDHDDFYRRRRR